MSFLDSMINKAKTITSDLIDDVKKFTNKEVMEGTMAACAMVANANGLLKPEEKRKLIGIIQRHEVLSLYEAKEVIDSFNKYMSDFEFDPDIGEGEALKMISKIKDQNTAQLVVRSCIAIGTADGDFDEKERAMVKKICRALKCDPGDFNV